MGRSFKAWHDFIKYRKFLRKSTIAVLKGDNESNVSLVKRCFDAMRHYKCEE
jgi:hypothetical protein